ncbi:MAG: hypothetical protein KatS3mg129_2205 [Leptospiraceae bacterium]|nr:MAG: hypothetical protein KatS3mg129_2205 [Leptospiraceae bacterium]
MENKKQFLQEIETNLKVLQKQFRLLKNLKEKLKKEELQNLNIKQLKEIKKILREISLFKEHFSLMNSFLQHINDLENTIEELFQNYEKQFYIELKNQLQEYSLHLEGRLPDLEIYYQTEQEKIFLYTLEILEDKVIFWYGKKIEKLFNDNKDIRSLIKKIANFHSELIQDRFNDNEFIEKLFEAYKFSLMKIKEDWKEDYIGLPVYYYEILKELNFLLQDKKFNYNPTKNSYKEYNKYCFAYDLSRLKTIHYKNYKLQITEATRVDTSKSYTNLWIPRRGGKYISQITFKNQ